MTTYSEDVDIEFELETSTQDFTDSIPWNIFEDIFTSDRFKLDFWTVFGRCKLGIGKGMIYNTEAIRREAKSEYMRYMSDYQ